MHTRQGSYNYQRHSSSSNDKIIIIVTLTSPISSPYHFYYYYSHSQKLRIQTIRIYMNLQSWLENLNHLQLKVYHIDRWGDTSNFYIFKYIKRFKCIMSRFGLATSRIGLIFRFSQSKKKHVDIFILHIMIYISIIQILSEIHLLTLAHCSNV